MEDDLRRSPAHDLCDSVTITDVAAHILDENLRDSRRLEMAGIRGRLQRATRDLRAKATKPKREPRSLEAGVSGNENRTLREGPKLVHDRFAQEPERGGRGCATRSSDEPDPRA